MKHLRTLFAAVCLMLAGTASVFADIAPLPNNGPAAPASYGYLDSIELIIVVAVAVLAAALVFVAFYRKEK